MLVIFNATEREKKLKAIDFFLICRASFKVKIQDDVFEVSGKSKLHFSLVSVYLGLA